MSRTLAPGPNRQSRRRKGRLRRVRRRLVRGRTQAIREEDRRSAPSSPPSTPTSAKSPACASGTVANGETPSRQHSPARQASRPSSIRAPSTAAGGSLKRGSVWGWPHWKTAHSPLPSPAGPTTIVPEGRRQSHDDSTRDTGQAQSICDIRICGMASAQPPRNMRGKCT